VFPVVKIFFFDASPEIRIHTFHLSLNPQQELMED